MTLKCNRSKIKDLFEKLFEIIWKNANCIFLWYHHFTYMTSFYYDVIFTDDRISFTSQRYKALGVQGYLFIYKNFE